ncbi:MAG: hypothetical protein ACLFNB_05035 [Candidatus Woesearchaeota archaeon]
MVKKERDPKDTGVKEATVERLWAIRRSAYFVEWGRVKRDL